MKFSSACADNAKRGISSLNHVRWGIGEGCSERRLRRSLSAFVAEVWDLQPRTLKESEAVVFVPHLDGPNPKEVRRPVANNVKIPVILVVDDQPELCHVVTLLAGDEYRCVEAWDGEAALRILNDTEVDVIVSDLRMPGMNGIELLRRAQSACPNAARILISGYSESDDIIESINKGHILYFLRKPFEKLAIRAILQQAVQHSRLMRDRARLVEELTCLNRELEQRVSQRTAELERKNAELIRTTEELNRTIVAYASLATAVEQAADSIVVTDALGAVQYVNPAFTAMTGYSKEEAEGQKLSILKSGSRARQIV